MSAKNGIVRLEDLPTKSVCVKFPDNLQKSMIKTAVNIVKGRYNLARKLSVEPTTIYDFEKCRFKSVELSFVKKLSDFLVKNNFEEFSLEYLETKLTSIKTKWIGKNIFRPKFPMNFNNVEGARLISGILFDGGLSSDLRPFYTNNEEFLIDNLITSVKEIVGNIEFNKRKNRNNLQVDFPKILGLIFINGLGILPGSKLFNNPSLPQFILNNPKLYSTFLQQAFDDEATVNVGLPNGGSKAIQLQQYNSQNGIPVRLTQLKRMIERFEINLSGPYGPTQIYNTKKGYTSYGFMIQITNQPDIRKFSETIGFSLPRKQQELELLLNSYKLPPRFKRGMKFDIVLKACKELKDNGDKITIKSIANKMNRKESYVPELVREMADQKKLNVKEELGEKEFELIE